MRIFECRCGRPLFFDNLSCVGCGSEVGFDPETREVTALDEIGDGLHVRADAPQGRRFRFCAHRTTEVGCNWLLPADDPNPFCLSCRLTRTIPDLSRPRNAARLRDIEAAKRRVLFALEGMGLMPVSKAVDPEAGLAFDLLELLPEQQVLTGHATGVITLNVAEADADYRERHRESFDEPYRTLIGHFRHELGHYYWDRLIAGTSWLEGFRALFGDERADYGDALGRHHSAGPRPDWPERHVSAYASAHPWEDWAESWAHYLHMQATLETVAAFRIDTSRAPLWIEPFPASALWRNEPGDDDERFLAWVNAWVVLTTALNEVARSMGQPDIYPFVLNLATVTKLHFVHCLVNEARGGATAAVPSTLAVPTA